MIPLAEQVAGEEGEWSNLIVCPPVVIFALWISSSSVCSEMDLESSATSTSMTTVPSKVNFSKSGSSVTW